MPRGRKKGHILKTALGSKVYTVLINNPEGISGYRTSQLVFGKQYGFQGRTFQILRLLSNENLVLYPKKTEGKAKSFKPIFSGFVELLNKNIPKNYKLDNEEKKRLTKIINRKWELPVDAERTNILGFFKMIIGIPSLVKITYPKSKLGKEDRELAKKLGATQFMIDFYIELFKLPRRTLVKLSHLIPYGVRDLRLRRDAGAGI